jgi:hypothetical protein
MPLKLLQSVLSPFLWIGTMVDSFHSFSFFQIEVISLWISKQIVLPSALISSAGIWSIPGDLWLFSLSIANSTLEALGSGTSGSAVCISACPTYEQTTVSFPIRSLGPLSMLAVYFLLSAVGGNGDWCISSWIKITMLLIYLVTIVCGWRWRNVSFVCRLFVRYVF